MSRADKKGAHRANYEQNKKRIFATQNTCGICGDKICHFHVTFDVKRSRPFSWPSGKIYPQFF